MPNQLFELVQPHDLQQAASRAFRLRCQHFFGQKQSMAKLHSSIDTLLGDGLLGVLQDTPSVRTWMWSAKRLLAALKEDGASLPMEALSHLELDEGRGSRINELLAIQLAGIAAGHAYTGRTSFSFRQPIKPPRSIYFDGVGTFDLPSAPSGDSIEISVECGVLTVSTEQWTCVLPHALRDGHFDGVLRVAPGTSLGYSDASLCRPEFQPFPQLRGRPANAQWLTQLQRCWSALENSNIPHVREHLQWCKSLIGLVSMSDCIGSGSREEALGLVYLPVGASDVDLAECILHEALHQQLFRIEESATLFEATTASNSNFYSPWRTDGRPLRMVLHGAFVFSGVARLHQAWSLSGRDGFLGDASAACKRAVESQQALDTVLRHAKLTAVGERVVNAVELELKDVLARTELSAVDSARSLARDRRHAFPTLLA